MPFLHASTQWASRVDKFLCHWFGLDVRADFPEQVTKQRSRITVQTHEPYRRARYLFSWRAYQGNYLQSITPEQKAKIGLALGKTIAKDLVISFASEPEDKET